MGFLKKHWFISIALGIAALFLFTRLYNILSVPIFTDEAIYIRWAQIAANDASWRFISLTDGKQPMYVWIAMILMKFIEDPLIAGRMVSVLAGVVSMVGMYFLASETFRNKKIGLLASFLYVIYPFALVYDRLALYDSLVAMFMIWALYFEILLIRHMRLDLALILGMIVGGGMLTKTSTDFALILLPFSLLLITERGKEFVLKTWKWTVFALVVIVLANMIYSILRLSPYFHIIDDKNYVFIYPFSEWLMHPFTYLFGNLMGLGGWLTTYMTMPFLVLSASSFFIGKKYLREKLLLLSWFIVPFIALAVFGRVIYPRFILFMTMPLIVLGAYSLYRGATHIKKLWMQVIFVGVFTMMFFVTDFLILTNFVKAPIPQSDKSQFIAAWPSGVGVKETVAYLKEKAKDRKISVWTEGTFGLMPYALEIYLHDNPNIEIVGYWPVEDVAPKKLIETSKKNPTYVIFYQPCAPCRVIGQAPPLWQVKPVLEFTKLEPGSNYTLYQVQ